MCMITIVYVSMITLFSIKITIAIIIVNKTSNDNEICRVNF